MADQTVQLLAYQNQLVLHQITQSEMDTKSTVKIKWQNIHSLLLDQDWNTQWNSPPEDIQFTLSLTTVSALALLAEWSILWKPPFIRKVSGEQAQHGVPQKIKHAK